jgi:hypothetical protein
LALEVTEEDMENIKEIMDLSKDLTVLLLLKATYLLLMMNMNMKMSYQVMGYQGMV